MTTKHELYVARLQERLDRVDEDAEYAELRERAGRPFDWALVLSFAPGDACWPVTSLRGGETAAQRGPVESAASDSGVSPRNLTGAA